MAHLLFYRQRSLMMCTNLLTCILLTFFQILWFNTVNNII